MKKNFVVVVAKYICIFQIVLAYGCRSAIVFAGGDYSLISMHVQRIVHILLRNISQDSENGGDIKITIGAK